MPAADLLKRLGAAEVISHGERSAPGKPPGKGRWASVVDSVGSHTLANACASTRCGGAVAACGLVRELDLSKLDAITQEIGLGQAVQAGSDILAGRVRGRLVVNVNA